MVIASVVVCFNYVVRTYFLSIFLNVHILYADLLYFGTLGIIIIGLSQYGLVQVATASLVGTLCARWGAVTPARVHYQAPSYGVVPHLVGIIWFATIALCTCRLIIFLYCGLCWGIPPRSS